MTSSIPGKPGTTDYALLLLLALFWGGSFLFIKIAIGTIPPVTLTALRLVVAGIFLFVAMLLWREKLTSLNGVWFWVVMSGFFGTALPFYLISWGEEHIDSAMAAILMAVMPLTTVLLAHMFTSDEKLNTYKAIGVLFGLAGLVVLIGPQTLLRLGEDTTRQLAVAGAAVCYGINALITKKLTGRPPRALGTGIIAASCALMVPASFLFERPLELAPSISAIWATIILGIIQTALATLLLVTIVRRQGASFFSQINFLIPLFGVVLGATFLGETIGLNALAALGLILIGIAITRYGGVRANRVAERQVR